MLTCAVWRRNRRRAQRRPGTPMHRGQSPAMGSGVKEHTSVRYATWPGWKRLVPHVEQLGFANLMAGTAPGTAQHRAPGAPPRPVGVAAPSHAGTMGTLPEHARRVVPARVAQRLVHLLGVGCAWLERCRTNRPPCLFAPPAARPGRSVAPHVEQAVLGHSAATHPCGQALSLPQHGGHASRTVDTRPPFVT